MTPAIILLGDIMPKKRAADIIYGQLLRASSSVGANYRSACRARSRADFISKITIVEEEADESCDSKSVITSIRNQQSVIRI